MIRCRTIAFLSAGVLVVLASGESLGAPGSRATGARARGDATVPATQRAFVRIRHSAGVDATAPATQRAFVPPASDAVPATQRAFVRIRHSTGVDIPPSADADVAPSAAADVAERAAPALGDDDSRPCYADCNADGRLTAADLGCFQTQFMLGVDADGNSAADCNRDGLLNVADFGCFQTALLRGCW